MRVILGWNGRSAGQQFRSGNREREFRNLARQIPEGPLLDWAAQLIPTLTTEAVITWLDAGQPDPVEAALRIRTAIDGVVRAANSAGTS